jgi:hypothetical protein
LRFATTILTLIFSALDNVDAFTPAFLAAARIEIRPLPSRNIINACFVSAAWRAPMCKSPFERYTRLHCILQRGIVIQLSTLSKGEKMTDEVAALKAT